MTPRYFRRSLFQRQCSYNNWFLSGRLRRGPLVLEFAWCPSRCCKSQRDSEPARWHQTRSYFAGGNRRLGGQCSPSCEDAACCSWRPHTCCTAFSWSVCVTWLLTGTIMVLLTISFEIPKNIADNVHYLCWVKIRNEILGGFMICIVMFLITGNGTRRSSINERGSFISVDRLPASDGLPQSGRLFQASHRWRCRRRCLVSHFL